MTEIFSPHGAFKLKPLDGVRNVVLNSADASRAEQIANDVLRRVHLDDYIENVKSDSRSVVWRAEDSGMYIKVFTDFIDGRGRYQRDLHGSKGNTFTTDNVAVSDNRLRAIVFNDNTGGLVRMDE